MTPKIPQSCNPIDITLQTLTPNILSSPNNISARAVILRVPHTRVLRVGPA